MLHHTPHVRLLWHLLWKSEKELTFSSAHDSIRWVAVKGRSMIRLGCRQYITTHASDGMVQLEAEWGKGCCPELSCQDSLRPSSRGHLQATLSPSPRAGILGSKGRTTPTQTALADSFATDCQPQPIRGRCISSSLAVIATAEADATDV
eukprot:2258218-Amphidinium_carterae.3